MIDLYNKRRFRIRLWKNLKFGYLNNGFTRLIDLGFLSIMINKKETEK